MLTAPGRASPHHSVCALDCRAPPWVSDTLWMWPALFWGTLSVFANSATWVVSTVWPRGLEPSRALCPWDSLRQEHWSGLPRPPPGDLPDPEIKPAASPVSSASQADLFPLSHPRSPPCPSMDLNWPSAFFQKSFVATAEEITEMNNFCCLFVCFKESCKGEGIWGKKATEDRDTRENKTQFYKEILQTSFIWFSGGETGIHIRAEGLFS